MLYIRMMLVIGITFYTARVLLRELGIEDYGIYNVVGGVISMMSFLNTSLANGFQRFFSTALGLGETKKIKEIFSVAITIQIGIGLVCLFVAETIGTWFLHEHMSIPAGRIVAAEWVFQTSVVIFLLALLRAPLQALVIAFEKMEIYAYVSIIEVFANLGIIFLLPVLRTDKLITYGCLMTTVNSVILAGYVYMVRRHCLRVTARLSANRIMVRELLSFSGWNLFGSVAHLMKGNGLNILLNMFFGPAVNAARGIAYQISTGVMTFVSNFQTATRPQTIKYYAAGETGEMLRLFFRISRFSFFLLWILSLPLMFVMEWVLDIWLGGNVPANTALFSRIVLATSLVEAFATPLTTIVHASGKMRKFQIICSSIILAIIPCAYILLHFGYPPESAMYASLTIVTIVHGVRLILLKGIITYSVRDYLRHVILPCITITAASLLPAILIWHAGMKNITGLYTALVLFLMGAASVWCCGLSRKERSFFLEKAETAIRKAGYGKKYKRKDTI